MRRVVRIIREKDVNVFFKGFNEGGFQPWMFVNKIARAAKYSMSWRCTEAIDSILTSLNHDFPQQLFVVEKYVVEKSETWTKED